MGRSPCKIGLSTGNLATLPVIFVALWQWLHLRETAVRRGGVYSSVAIWTCALLACWAQLLQEEMGLPITAQHSGRDLAPRNGAQSSFSRHRAARPIRETPNRVAQSAVSSDHEGKEGLYLSAWGRRWVERREGGNISNKRHLHSISTHLKW